MLRHYARLISKLKWLIIVLWIAAVAAVFLFLPSLQGVVSHQSQTYLPNSAESVIAGNLANQIDTKHQSQSTVIVAIHNPNGLTTADKEYLARRVTTLQSKKSSYHITYVEDPANSPASAKNQFLSHDKTTEISVIGLTQGVTDPTIGNTLNHLYGWFTHAPSGSRVYFTGDVPIQEDALHGSLNAAKKTAVVTVILVLTILFSVFRSLLAPLLTLIAIGLSYLVSSGVVAWAAEHGLPVSTFTQTFLIVILMGAGTDYTMIMMNRFREELMRTHDNEEAMVAALKGVSKTVIVSGLTVLISFAVLYFARFGLYRSAVGISLGIFVTLLNCLTLVPAVMSLLGRSLYWPRQPKPGHSHRPSRIWSWSSAISTKRPWTVLLILTVVLTPIALLFTNDRTFNPMIDIPNATSVTGFNVISKAFGKGQVMPTTVVLKTSGDLRTEKGMATISQISKTLASVPGVKEVSSATQPTGNVIQGFQLAYQNQQAAVGLGQIHKGLSTLAKNLGGATGQGGTSRATAGTSSSTVGSSAATAGTSAATGTSPVGKLQSGSAAVTSGIDSLAKGASQLANHGQQLATGAKNLSRGLAKVGSGLSSLASGESQVASANGQVARGASALANAIAAWAKQNPSATKSPSWQQIQQLAAQLSQGTTKTASASTKLATGTHQAAKALTELQSALNKMANGTTQYAAGVNKLAVGASQLGNASMQVTGGIGQLNAAMGSEMTGLGKAASGATQLEQGVSQVQRFLHESRLASEPGFYIPTASLQNKQLKQAMDAYISQNGHVAKFSIVLNANPYSMEAIHTMAPLRQAAETALAATPIHHGTIYVGGTTGTQANMNLLSSQDFVRTMSIVFSAIFLLLVLLLRSVLTPLFSLLSLAATYFVTMGIVQNFAVHVMHQPGVNWAVPFFAFLLLVALGVDYSIFLTSRFDEEYRAGRGPIAAIRHAMGTMGNVVFSAALIMAGTFGSMIVTGMSTLTEIGLCIVIGLFLYTFLMLGFFTPAIIGIIGRGHAWPFIKVTEENPDELDGVPTV